MAVYLRWKDYSVGSKERFIADLFSTLSPRWYPVNIIGSNLYDIFEMYAIEFASASVETGQTFNDLFFDTVRTTPVGMQTTTKIYDNFGVLLGVNKLSEQTYETFNTGSILQSYRQQLRLLSEAFFAGASVEGTERVGQAYTGVAPIVLEPAKTYPGWTLTTITGSVLGVGPDYLVSETYVPHLGFLLPADTSGFVVDDIYILSYSKLGYNTIIRDGQFTYSGVKIHIYASASVSNSFVSSIEQAFERVLPANIEPQFIYSSNFVYYRPQTGSVAAVIDSVFSLSEQGYLYNTGETSVDGSSFTGSVVVLPADYAGYDWYYDWLVLVRNEARYRFEVRSYPSASIPETVYYSQYNPYPVELLGSSSSVAAHWVFNTPNTLWDIAGNGANLTRVQALGAQPSLGTARDERRVALFADSDAMVFTGSVASPLNLTNSFTCEMWVKGIDKTLPITTSVVVKRQNVVNYTPTLTSNGYMFAIDGGSATMKLATMSSSGSIVSGSISSYLSEEPERYHYFAYTFVSGSVYLYIDGNVVAQSASVITPASLSGDTFTVVAASGSGVAIDEVVVYNSFLSPTEALSHFTETKPRFLRTGISSGSVEQYHQPKIIVYASGSGEAEFHQFSIRALDDQGLHVASPGSVDVYRLPIFELGPGDII